MTTLYLIPTSLNPEIDASPLSIEDKNIIKHLRHFIVETPKIARQHLKQLNLTTNIQDIHTYELNKHNHDLSNMLEPLLRSIDMGLISDCGTPAIADPGAQIVRLAHNKNITVKPLSVPSSLLLALMASGVNGQAFAFQGYLPINDSEKKAKIQLLEKLIITQQQSQIIIETPFRNQQLLTYLINCLNPTITLCVAINLTTNNEIIISKPIKQWQQQTSLPAVHKQEAVFVLGI